MACRAFWTGFYIWISILPEICTALCSKFPSSSRVQNTHKSALPTTLIFKTILGSVNTGVNTELQNSTIFWNINYQLRAHINGPQTPVNHFMHRVSPYPLIIFLKKFFGNCEYLICYVFSAHWQLKPDVWANSDYLRMNGAILATKWVFSRMNIKKMSCATRVGHLILTT